jgi:hypothetical protein
VGGQGVFEVGGVRVERIDGAAGKGGDLLLARDDHHPYVARRIKARQPEQNPKPFRRLVCDADAKAFERPDAVDQRRGGCHRQPRGHLAPHDQVDRIIGQQAHEQHDGPLLGDQAEIHGRRQERDVSLTRHEEVRRVAVDSWEHDFRGKILVGEIARPERDPEGEVLDIAALRHSDAEAGRCHARGSAEKQRGRQQHEAGSPAKSHRCTVPMHAVTGNSTEIDSSENRDRE